MVICLEQGADLHMAQLMTLPLTVSCFSKIQIGLTSLVVAYLSSPGKGAVKRVCVCVCVRACVSVSVCVCMLAACVMVCCSCTVSLRMCLICPNVNSQSFTVPTTTTWRSSKRSGKKSSTNVSYLLSDNNNKQICIVPCIVPVFVPSVLWCCCSGCRKGIRPVKNWVVGCWHGFLSGARCRLAYGPADATATHCLLLQ